MEKLLQLLNEYLLQTNIVVIEQEIEGRRDIFFENEDGFHVEEAEIISKKFGFIERLVSNKKLNLIDFKEVVKEVEFTDNEEFDRYIFYSITDSLLMLLAISDDPIEFLVSVLK